MDRKVIVGAKVPKAVAEELQRISQLERRTVSQLILFALEDYIAKKKKAK